MKRVVALLLVFVLSFGTVTFAYESEISVLINGQKVAFDVPPMILDGRTLVPLRAIFESLGATVDFNEQTRTITASKNKTKVTLVLDNPEMSIDKETFTLDVPPTIVDGRTLAPVRAVSEAFDCHVDWKGETRTVLITDESLFNDYNLNTTFCGDPTTERGFSWEADNKMKNMVLQYGESADNLTTEIPGRMEKAYVSYYNTKSLDGTVKNYYKAELTKLIPGKTYYYRIGDKTLGGFSKVYSFTTAENNTEDFSIVAFTDTQGTNDSNYGLFRTVVNKALTECPQAAFMCNVGDITDYGQCVDLWDYYFNSLEGIKESLPAVAVMGNHETRINEDAAPILGIADGAKLYNLYFNNPQNAAGFAKDLRTQGKNIWTNSVIKNADNSIYSFDYKDAHFVVLNTGTDWDNPGMFEFMKAQRDWLRKDLKSTDKKWKIVLMHRPMYAISPGDESPKSAFMDILDSCGVDLVLQGHDHAYMRTYQMKGDLAVDKNLTSVTKGMGTVYAVIGASAARLHTITDNESSYIHRYAAVAVSVASNPTYTIINLKQDKLECITKTVNGIEIDRFEIVMPQ